MPTLLHVASVFPSNSNRLALQFKYAEDEWNLELLHLTAPRSPVQTPDRPGYRVQCLPHFPRHSADGHYLLRRVRSLLRRIFNFVALAVAIVRSKADVMHAHEHSSLWPLALWAWILRRPAVWDPHDYFRVPAAFGRRSFRLVARQCMERLSVQCGTPILTVSRGMRAEYVKLYPDANIVTVRNYSSDRSVAMGDASSISERVTELMALRSRKANGNIRLIYPGLIKPERFSLALIQTIGSMTGVSLDIYGEDRSGRSVHKNALMQMLAEKNIDSVKLRGLYTSDNIVNILREYHFAILPYAVTHANIDFCLPNKFYQCIEAGLPLITTAMRELGEIITTFGLGYTFPSGDHEACAAILENCRKGPDKYVALVENAVTYQLTQLDYEEQKATLLDAYATALSHKKVPSA